MNYPEARHLLAKFATGCFFCTLLATLFPPVNAWAGDQANSFSKVPESSFRWTASVEAIVLNRTGGVSRALIERVPGSVHFNDTFTTPGTEAFNSSEFQQGFSGGPKLDLIYQSTSGYSTELAYFNIFNQSATKAVGPHDPADWLVMRAPGFFWQTQDFPYQAMVWSATTSLYGIEANRRLALSNQVTILAGFRWLQLNDNLEGTLTPADATAPTWKNDNPDIFHITAGDTAAGNYPPFWNTSTVNNLYGFQVGVNGTILELGRFSLDGLVKIGIYDNDAEQSTGVSLQKVVYPTSASANQVAFASEAGLQLKYHVMSGMKLKAGYEALWLEGVALAPGQIQETFTTVSGVRALGVNCGSNVLFQGFTAGLEYAF